MLEGSRGATTAALEKTRQVMLAVAYLESFSERERQVYTPWFAGSLSKTIALKTRASASERSTFIGDADDAALRPADFGGSVKLAVISRTVE